MRAVLDTNVLASGFVRANANAAPARLIDAWRAGAFTLLLSEQILFELARTFTIPYFSAHLSSNQQTEDLALLRQRAIVLPVTAFVHGVATHPEDDLILATAVSAHADYLVTGDAQLLRLAAYEGVTILSPRTFLDLLGAQNPE